MPSAATIPTPTPNTAAAAPVWSASDYEKEALRALHSKGMDGFPEAMAQLHFFYQLNPSQRKNEMLMCGLHLMYLLVVKNDRTEFHTLLKSIGEPDSRFVSLPVQLEQSFDQGHYNKVLLTEKNVPDKNYTVFIPILTEALRAEIAGNMEVSYKRLNIKMAAELLLFGDEKEALAFAIKRGWKVSTGESGPEFQFPHPKQGTGVGSSFGVSGDDKPSLDANRIARQLIGYAKELEKIV